MSKFPWFLGQWSQHLLLPLPSDSHHVDACKVLKMPQKTCSYYHQAHLPCAAMLLPIQLHTPPTTTHLIACHSLSCIRPLTATCSPGLLCWPAYAIELWYVLCLIRTPRMSLRGASTMQTAWGICLSTGSTSLSPPFSCLPVISMWKQCS